MKKSIVLLLLTVMFLMQGIAQNFEHTIDTIGSKIYKTARIGEQIWMAENLKYDIDSCKKEIVDGKYLGNRYNYHQAVKCAKEIEGWHLPAIDEVVEFLTYIEKTYGTSDIEIFRLMDQSAAMCENGKSGFDAVMTDTTYIADRTVASTEFWIFNPEIKEQDQKKELEVTLEKDPEILNGYYFIKTNIQQSKTFKIMDNW
ncbi:MAG: hypothetical protein JW798_17725, partial [Prolixibacteraceae bacterium]|nr:hypothetical protein [Prolixibacteraceae bacterium]